jgi:hypothetical protein
MPHGSARRRKRRRGRSGRPGCLTPRRALYGAAGTTLFGLWALSLHVLLQILLVPLAVLGTLAFLLLSAGLAFPTAGDLMLRGGQHVWNAWRGRVSSK